ncbi:hypothetical protein PCANC_17152 [Puccinia coronata f. sp. avenae]|uniref:Uncharacterized protein n=1 Tax=Puccinia coronata f. sp. avenae TaxID=200324 RepID=A0A2N5UIV8_9BASI|nr:hypothetical protein PCANC_17152 [Puccinia coronata f. sp. avenae]
MDSFRVGLVVQLNLRRVRNVLPRSGPKVSPRTLTRLQINIERRLHSPHGVSSIMFPARSRNRASLILFSEEARSVSAGEVQLNVIYSSTQ